jgi:ferritin-like metal-binding protein YciE
MTKSTIDRLTSLGEDVIGKASQYPTANRVLQGAMQMKERVDDLSKRVRGLEAMEKHITQLEKRIAKLEKSVGTKRATTKTRTTRKSAPESVTESTSGNVTEQ